MIGGGLVLTATAAFIMLSGLLSEPVLQTGAGKGILAMALLQVLCAAGIVVGGQRMYSDQPSAPGVLRLSLMLFVAFRLLDLYLGLQLKRDASLMLGALAAFLVATALLVAVEIHYRKNDGTADDGQTPNTARLARGRRTR